MKKEKHFFVEDNVIAEKDKEEIIKKKLERLKELERFGSELKRRIRSLGKSTTIPIEDIDELIIKYNIKYVENGSEKN